MKKTKYIYSHDIYGGTFIVGRKEMIDFFRESGVKLHLDEKKDYYYSWEFAGDKVSWFTFFGTEEVELSQEVTKIPTENKYENGMNWKGVGKKTPNVRLRKPQEKKKTNKRPPINPRTGLRDGGA